jgi:hypothetical protein
MEPVYGAGIDVHKLMPAVVVGALRSGEQMLVSESRSCTPRSFCPARVKTSPLPSGEIAGKQVFGNKCGSRDTIYCGAQECCRSK